mgnify:FL=1|tara:strand:+ start:416 stop:535 length:120 start_codon:yes stop_codon:yes gene_type:complete
MKSAAQTKHDKTIANKLSLLVGLWIIDKIIMLLMLAWMK